MDLSSVKEAKQTGPQIQMAPLIDIVFLLLIFFMSASVFYQLESEINITVPVAEKSTDMKRTAGEIIINIRQDGTIVVNQRELDHAALRDMLVRVAELYKNQPVIIRADRDTLHKDVIKVLDICASSGIWNVSFATIREKDKK
ncbi:MAG: biopolymer transporter ExbD [Candidatus Omnitrophica bacterium]|nr:biopolymer transporter ExbD [Candidatus Omnitrophota bacterium]MDD5487530.1 biopolymer transporter ExbD [Candidatus Omnitrophota bacterium]